MTEVSDPVEVIVDIVDQFSDELLRLKEQIESLDDVINIDLIIRDAEIALTKAKLEALDKTTIRPKVDPAFREITQPPMRVVRSGGVMGRGAINQMFAEGFVGSARLGRSASSMLPDQLPLFERIGKLIRKKPGDEKHFFQRLTEGLKRLLPSWHTWVTLIALILPMLITLGVAALGVATAFGAIALAGGAIVGLGLLGEGESMAEAFENAQAQLKQFKKELFKTFQPTARVFQPFSQEFLETAPHRLRGLASELEQLTAFADSFNDAFDGIANWLGEAISATAGFEQEIEQLAQRFGQIVGTSIIDFFAFLVEEAYTNQDAIIQLGKAFVDIAAIIYNLSKVFAFIVAGLEPVLQFFAWLTDLLDNRLLIAFASFALVGILVGKMFFGMTMAVASFIQVLGLLNVELVITNALLAKAAILMSVLTLGAAALAGLAAWQTMSNLNTEIGSGGRSLGNAVGGGAQNTFVMNVNGDVSRRNMRRFESVAKTTYNSEQDASRRSTWP